MNHQPDIEPLLTPGEVALMFRVQRTQVTRWAKAGKLTVVRTLGGHRRYLESEVRGLLASHPYVSGPAAPSPGALPPAGPETSSVGNWTCGDRPGHTGPHKAYLSFHPACGAPVHTWEPTS